MNPQSITLTRKPLKSRLFSTYCTHLRLSQFRPKFLTLCLILLCSAQGFATHNRAGEIHVRQTGPLTVEATIITWTKTSSFTVDRDTLTICWGDGTCQLVSRTNSIEYPNDVKYNTYVATHTYSGQAKYTISMTDPNRIVGIANVNPPASDNIPFHIQTTFSFQSVQFGGTNTTPYLLQPPVDQACVNKPYKHNPNAFDPDGDSLSYLLVVPYEGVGDPVPNYSYPNTFMPGIDNIFQLDPITGDLIWFTPKSIGVFNIAIAVISWRNGTPIDTTVRDMQITVSNCDNNPPVIETIDELCVVAGQVVEFDVSATDPDGDRIRLTALGGPFSTPYSPASFIVPQGWQNPPIQGTFRWQTDCEHISNQPYSVVFKAVDTVSNSVPQLADLKTVSIKVVGPAPEDVQATANIGTVEISWKKPYICEETDNDYFYGFAVWRREGSLFLPADTCNPGLKGKGYTEVVFITREEKDGRYYYKDNSVERGRTYCYRVEAKFARISGGGFPYNVVESLPSPEVCVQLPRDLPLMVQTSVEATATNTGQISVCWIKPKASDLDTILNPGPYRYQLFRAPGLSGGTYQEVPGASFVADAFWKANDTCFLDQNINTVADGWHYRVGFYVRGAATELGFSNASSTVFLSVQSKDEENILSWKEVVPWANFKYDIFRLNPLTAQFDSIGSTVQKNYADQGLTNGISYCYKIRSIGTYSVEGIRSPLINWSQESCGTPLDTLPPCTPTLGVTNRCTSGTAINEPDPPYENLLSWTNPNLVCEGRDDTEQYNVWYKAEVNDPFELLTTVVGADNITYIHQQMDGLIGCYAVSAIDSLGNESTRSNVVCVDNCPQYELPNTFTPNGDGSNDLFVPFPGWSFIQKVDFQVFNRWGNLVFATTDPALLWDGTTSDGKQVADGTYHYICKVFEDRQGGPVQRPGVLSGWIEVIASGR